MTIADPVQPRIPPSYTVPLSSSLSTFAAFPAEVCFAEIEPHGAVLLCRFASGEHVEQFELSGAEFDALVATHRRRHYLLKRASAVAFSELDGLPF